jgi:hypothetical protein
MCFGYRDGGVRDVRLDELVDRVAILLGEERARCRGPLRPGRHR